MTYEHILVQREGPFATVTMNRPERRNALSQQHLGELLAAFRSIGDTDATGVVLAANGPVFSAGHDFADLAGADLHTVQQLLLTCTDLMQTMQSIPSRRPPDASWSRRPTWPSRPSPLPSPRREGRAVGSARHRWSPSVGLSHRSTRSRWR
jgi:hypothetical protein